MKICLTEALKYTQEDKHLAVSLENAKCELSDAEKEYKWLKSAVASSEKEHDQIKRKTEEIQMDLESERFYFFLISNVLGKTSKITICQFECWQLPRWTFRSESPLLV